MVDLFLRNGDLVFEINFTWVNFENFSWTPHVNLQKSPLLEILLLD